MNVGWYTKLEIAEKRDVDVGMCWMEKGRRKINIPRTTEGQVAGNSEAIRDEEMR